MTEAMQGIPTQRGHPTGGARSAGPEAAEALHRHRMNCDYLAAGNAFPAAFACAAGHDNPAVRVGLFIDGVFTAKGLGSPATAWMAATWARHAAERSGHPCLIAEAAFTTAVLAVATHPADSKDLADEALRFDITTPALAAASGMLHLVRALASIRTSTDDGTRDLHTAHTLTGPATGAPDRHGLGFGPSNVLIWQLQLALAVDDLDAASFAASQEPTGVSPSRRAGWHLLRAELDLRIHRPDAAARALRTAFDIAPLYVVTRNGFAALARATLEAGSWTGPAGELRRLLEPHL
ncbi:hypothetical protein ACFQ9X_21290 [Catenulispora yoronensis]